MHLNAALNGVEVETTSEDLLRARTAAADVVLVGDLLLRARACGPRHAYIEAAAASGTHVLIGDPKRSYFPTGRFKLAAEYQVPVTRELEDAEIKRTSVRQL